MIQLAPSALLPNGAADGARLKALLDYEILDTPAEAAFDDIAEIARHGCATPVALVSLVAADRQWFKARIGFALDETPLEQSVCIHALSASDLLVIPDLARDPRTAANPLVTGDPFIRFYAGAPLQTASGQCIGSLCVIDTEPRPEGLQPPQAATLRALARQVMSQLELRRAIRQRDEMLAQQRLEAIRRETLMETQAAVSSANGDLDVILDVLVRGAMKAIPAAEGGAIEMLDGRQLVYRSARGTLAPHLGLRLPIDGSLSGECFRTRQPVLCSDARGDPRAHPTFVQRADTRAALFVPVLRGGETIAVLMLQSGRPSGLSPQDLDVARLFAGTAAAGLAEVGEAAARRQIGRSERRHRAIFESATDYAIVVLDLAGRITDWNAGACRILGWTADETRNRPAALFFTPEDGDADVPADEMRAALAEGRGAAERWYVRKDGSRFWASGEMMALRDGDSTAIGFVKILRDRTEQKKGEAALQEQRRNLAAVLDTIPVGVLFAEAPSGRIVGGNRWIEDVLRHPVLNSAAAEDYGEWVAFHADGRRVQALEYPLARIIREGRDHAALECEYQRGDGSRLWISITGAPMRNPDGTMVGAVVAIADIDARRRADEMQGLMNHELSHRMKNLLTVVQAIVRQTIRGATDLETLQQTLADRINVLGTAHDVLLGGPIEQAPVAALIRSGTGVLGEASKGQLTVEGPHLEIGGRAALPLGLMLHELSTNAVKYGALSTPEGHVHVAWSVVPGDGQGRFVLEWRESGGPPVAPPPRKGFGSRLIERGVAGLGGGSVTLDFRPEGLVCRVEAPICDLVGGG